MAEEPFFPIITFYNGHDLNSCPYNFCTARTGSIIKIEKNK